MHSLLINILESENIVLIFIVFRNDIKLVNTVFKLFVDLLIGPKLLKPPSVNPFNTKHIFVVFINSYLYKLGNI